MIEYQRIPGGSLVPNVCVGSRKEVLSVVLVSKDKQLEDIRSVALDESSRTSATLVKVIFREFLDREPEWTTRAPNIEEMLEKNDAALIIGDPGMGFPQAGAERLGHGGLVESSTPVSGLFLRCGWCGTRRSSARACVDFSGARDEGVAHIEEIVRSYQDKIPMPVEELRNYLTENIVFNVDESMEKGLRLYFELAFKHGLIESVKPLRFISTHKGAKKI